MLAQISLTPTESKKLIGLAVAQMELVKLALQEGMVVVHPSTSTYFVAEAILGSPPQTNVWLKGAIVQKGACIERGYFDTHPEVGKSAELKLHPPSDLLVVERGRIRVGEPLEETLDRMGPGDVYIKGANALDIKGNVGILFGSGGRGASLSRILAASRQKQFNIIFPVGLEKLIPVSIDEASHAAKARKYEYAMGITCGLMPCDTGMVVTEIKALHMLSGVVATPISCGGVGGAEGATTMVLEGAEEQVLKAIGYAERSKGAILPQVRLFECKDCPNTSCDSSTGGRSRS